MIHVKTLLKKSEYHGLGVYSNQKIKKGTLIWSFDASVDRVISSEEFEEMSEPDRKNILHYSYMTDNKYIYCGDMGRYFNHSSNPNTKGIESHDGFGQTIADRDIEIGEELTCDYLDTDDSFKDKLKENKFV